MWRTDNPDLTNTDIVTESSYLGRSGIQEVLVQDTDGTKMRFSDTVWVTYLCYYAPHEPLTADRTAVYCEDGDWYWHGDEDTEYERVLVPVIAWQPKPEPYGGEE